MRFSIGTAILTLSFWAFVFGGFAFNGVFLANVRALRLRPDVTVEVPVVGTTSIGALTAPVTLPGKIAEARQNPPQAAALLLPEWQGRDRLNILLLGIDRRQDEPFDGARSDTIMLASIDPVTKSAALVSLPRDLWVNIPGFGEQRINVAHAVGGPDLAKRTVTADFGIPIKYYVRVDFKGFEDVVNTVGGIIVDVDRPVKDDEYPAGDYGYQRIYVEPGPQLMVGQTALQYARSRHSENDFGRAARQQKVVLAIRERALQLNMLPRAPELLGILQKAVSTDIPAGDMLSLARLASEVDRERIANLVVDTELARPAKGEGGADILLPDTAAIRAAIDRVLKTAARPELRARIEVLNGTTRTGYGQRVNDFLAAQGFDVVRVAAADRTDYQTSTLQVLDGNRTAAESLAKALRIPTSSIQDAEASASAQTPNVALRFIIGQDFIIPPQ